MNSYEDTPRSLRERGGSCQDRKDPPAPGYFLPVVDLLPLRLVLPAVKLVKVVTDRSRYL